MYPKAFNRIDDGLHVKREQQNKLNPTGFLYYISPSIFFFNFVSSPQKAKWESVREWHGKGALSI